MLYGQVIEAASASSPTRGEVLLIINSTLSLQHAPFNDEGPFALLRVHE